VTARRDRAADEARARTGWLVISAARFSGIAMIVAGFAVVRGLIDLPYAAGVVLAVAGFVDFFFVPRLVARSFRTGESRKE